MWIAKKRAAPRHGSAVRVAAGRYPADGETRMMRVRVCVLAFLTALERGHRARMSPPPPRARRRRRLRRTTPASDSALSLEGGA